MSGKKKKKPGSKDLRKGRQSAPNRYYYITKKASTMGTRILVEPENHAEILIGRIKINLAGWLS